ncbi:hypothetical protein OH77DRAFT_440088 [Trametes cingulata]|nr:hypothetical protein OH77DRAFT_440088 [Trametes cingulata]
MSRLRISALRQCFFLSLTSTSPVLTCFLGWSSISYSTTSVLSACSSWRFFAGITRPSRCHRGTCCWHTRCKISRCKICRTIPQHDFSSRRPPPALGIGEIRDTPGSQRDVWHFAR